MNYTSYVGLFADVGLTTALFLLNAAAVAIIALGLIAYMLTRRRAEQETRRNDENFRLMIEQAPDAVFVADVQGRYTAVNETACKLLGFDRAELVGKTIRDLIRPQEAERLETVRREQLQGGGQRGEWELRRKDGGYVPVDVSSRILPNGRWLAFVRDLSGPKQAERELELSRVRMDLVVNSVEVGLWYCDLPFDKLIWNVKVKEHFGLPADYDVTIDAFYERLHPDDRERTRKTIEKSISDHVPYDIEYRTVGLDGRERWVRAIGRTFYDAAGAPIRFDGITVDVTERVLRENELRQAAAELSEASRRKDEFLAMLAHELRNPLAPVRNSLEVMKRVEDDKELTRRARTTMERQVGHMVKLIDDLLEISRVSRGKLELKRERVELASVIHQAVEQVQPHVAAANHALTVTTPPEPIYLDADPVRLAQVFSNLLNNACKFTPNGGRIGLTVASQGGAVEVSVRDTGVGVAPDQLSNIFDLFTQVDQSLERTRGGLGIGLTLVKRLVEMHGGSVKVRSEGLGKGSEFIVRLPVVVETPPRLPMESTDGKDGQPRMARRFLVADDNRDAADSLAMLLRLTGGEVHTAYDGQEAVEAAARLRPEVILLDIGMPRLNGYEACRRIREQPWSKSIFLAALTGWGQEEDRRKSKEAGFDDHLVKPVRYDAILTMLAGLPDGVGKQRSGSVSV